MKQWILATCLTGAMALGSAVVNAQQISDPSTVARPAKVQTIAASSALLYRDYSAVVFPSQEVELSFRVSGRVTQLPVRGATQVQQGDVIAQLDPRDFEAKIAQLLSQRDQAEAQLQALRSGARAEEVAALEAAVAAAQAQADQASDTAERTRKLAESGTVAKAKLDQDEAALRVALADLRAQQEQLRIGTSGGRAEDVEAAEAALRGLESQLSTARDNLADATLTAPFSGIIARRDIDNFTNIQAGQNIVLLQALSVINLAFDVPGSDVIALSDYGDPTVSVQFDALPGQRFQAELVEFSTQANAATQTYRARVAVDLAEHLNILPGMIGHIFIEMDSADTVSLNIPLSAVTADPSGAPFVWLVQPGDASGTGTVSRRDITLGEASGDMISVLSGLADGDTVVIAGVSKLQDGMAIRPVTKIGG